MVIDMPYPKTLQEVIEQQVQIEKDRANAYKRLLEKTTENINELVNNRVQCILATRRAVLTVRQRHPFWTIYEFLKAWVHKIAGFIDKQYDKLIEWYCRPPTDKDDD